MYTNDLKGKGLEIVFVSSDRDEEAFNGYAGEQPWLSLPFADRAAKAKLSKKYKVQGIPSFVILDGTTGETITLDGREAVMEDPKGADFPWKPPTFWDALGTEFLQGEAGETVSVDEIRGKGKTIGLYFSAHWCGPCRGFTPNLITAYNDHLKKKDLEIIFVSSDRSPADFQSYFGTMPWLGIPPEDPRKAKLSKLFGVQGIPTFALVNGETGETISTNARGKVSGDPEGKEFPWHPKPLNDMVADGPGDINEEVTLCVMMEGCTSETAAAAQTVLLQIAEKYKAAKKEITFLYAAKTAGPTPQIRSLTKIGNPTDTPQMVLLDIPDEGGFYVSPATEVSTETVTSFLEAYEAKALDRKQLG